MNKEFMWTMLVHLGNNMWNEEGNMTGREKNPEGVASSVLRFDRKLWDEYMEYMRKCGVNTVIIDVAEAMIYESHPELAVEGSWTKEEMRAEVERLQNMGFEVVPKLNFSAGHDIWLKDYSFMLSTELYRQVCADLIKEVAEVFKPKYFHLGMDEETEANQANYYYTVIRKKDMYWRDFYHLVDCVEKENARPWIWSDRMWEHEKEFLEKMPKEVLQSNWYYPLDFDHPKTEYRAHRLKCFETLAEHGFDQVPTGSNWSYYDNMHDLAQYCVERIPMDKLKGFMQTPWFPFINTGKVRNALFSAADALEDTIHALK